MEPSSIGSSRGDAEYPCWSPDGRHLAFMSLGFPPGGASIDYDIYVVGADGTGLRRLTNLPGEDGWPAWSPDGRTIAFVHQRSEDIEGVSDIYTMAANGGEATRITPGNGDLSYDYPDWSPDGSLILFSAYPATGPGGGIFVMRADGSGLTRMLGDGVAPTWRPS